MTEMCKYVACLQLVTVVMNCVNISGCDYVDSDGVTTKKQYRSSARRLRVSLQSESLLGTKRVLEKL
jgi:hypothetical protein